MEPHRRIEWNEDRTASSGGNVRFFVMAEPADGKWKFYDKEVGESRWFRVKDPEVVARLTAQVEHHSRKLDIHDGTGCGGLALGGVFIR